MFRCHWVFLLLTILVLGDVNIAAAVEPDDYLGDAAIYTGVPSLRPRPNVLLLIDTSRATMNRAPGQGYDPAESYSSADGFINDRIYIGDNFGEFNPSKPLGTVTLFNTGGDYVNCTTSYDVTDPDTSTTVTKTVNVQSILADNGTYSGAGSIDMFPVLDTDGTCAGASKGKVYATGNYLNYTHSDAVVDAGSIIIQHTFGSSTTCERIRNPSGKGWITNCGPFTRNYLLTADLASTVGAAGEPGIGSNWTLYWSETSSSPRHTPESFRATSPRPGPGPMAGAWEQIITCLSLRPP